MAQPLILYSDNGNLKAVYGANSNINSEAYTKGKVDCSDSYYVIYSGANFIEPGSKAIVDSSYVTDFGFAAKSAAGFKKDGITLFQHYSFSGNGQNFTDSVPDTTVLFPGISSFIVTKGWWTLYTGKNFTGQMVTNRKITKFGPGIRYDVPLEFNDKVQSIQYSPTP